MLTTLGLCATLTVFAAYFLTAHLYAVEQQGHSVVKAAAAELRAKGACQVRDEHNALFDRLRNEIGYRAAGNRWWRLDFGPDAYVNWVWRDLLAQMR